MKSYTLPQNSFILLLALVTVAFLAVLAPFGTAIFWAIVLAVVFAPLHARILRTMANRRNTAAALAVLSVVLMLIVPVAIIAVSLLDQAAHLYSSTVIRKSDFDTAYRGLVDVLPTWTYPVLDRFEEAFTTTLPGKLDGMVAHIARTAGHYAVQVGRNAFSIALGGGVMLYLLFFLFRDGRQLAVHVQYSVPLSSRYKSLLSAKLVTVVRATVRGNVLVALAQGTLGGLIFWLLDVPGPLLWGVVMTLLSLVPAIGAAAIWGPVAAYFLVVGAVFEGVILALYGALVIGLVDNLLRPILVGKDTKLPDWMVLLTTLGGMALFGFNGFVIGPLIAALFVATWDLLTRSSEFYSV